MEFRIIGHGMVDSTSERAFAALAEGSARHGDVHVARGQTAGRGRRGARWESPVDQGLYASVVLKPGKPWEPAAVTMGAGLAVLAALVDLGLAGARLKWPNDLLVGRSKLCGILAEARGLDPAAPECVLGIGVDVAQREFPPELIAERPVTSLALSGVETSPERVLAALLPRLGAELDRVLEAPEDVAARYFAALGVVGRRVRVETGGETLVGLLRGANLARGLEIEREVGPPRRVRLEHVRALTLAEDGPA